ncbi:fimbria/pilus periplasmic chaperone [Escherichia coli]|nr:fimbria/pilus periplasmic chaperone [Escherichia coli]
MTSKVFSLHLGATRVIYDLGSAGATLTVLNDQDYPILVQSEVFTEDQKNHAPFIITPPLFRLDPLQSNRLRIVRTGGAFPDDRESLQWICVRGIPPKEGDKWSDVKRNEKQGSKVSLRVQFSVSSCVKLFIRPQAIKEKSYNAAQKLEWYKFGSKLKGVNPTPFYINLSEISVGGKAVDDIHYISPFSSYEYTIPSNTSGKVKWRAITDYGGHSSIFESELKKF